MNRDFGDRINVQAGVEKKERVGRSAIFGCKYGLEARLYDGRGRGKNTGQKVTSASGSTGAKSSGCGRSGQGTRSETVSPVLTFCGPDVDLDGGITARVENLQM